MVENGENKKEHASASVLNKIRANPWILASIFLALVVIVILFVKGGGFTGGAISESEASDKLTAFVEAQGGTVDIVSTAKEGSLYKITMNYQGEEIPVYVTNDGKYLIPSLVPLSAQDAGAEQTAASGTAARTQEVPKSAKPVVELFVMALCPYGLQMEKGALPVANLLKDKIDFKIKFVYYAMHGQKEIDENTNQYCIQKEQSSKLNSYLACYLDSGDGSGCLVSSGIDMTKLTACIAAADKQFKLTENFNDKGSWLSGQFPKYDVDAADNTKYNVGGSPTLIINGVQASSARDPASLLKTICGAFTTQPAECKQTLSSAAPSPGFGAAAASGSSGSGSAGCATPTA